MANHLRNVLINSTLAFVSAFIVTTIIHEGGHFISYVLFGAHPTLFHNSVKIPDLNLSVHVKVVSALAGPVFSLCQGVLFGIIVSRGRRRTAAGLFMLWLSLLGYINFFGYLVMTPLSTAGDTGRVAELLSLGYPIRIGAALVGFAALLWLVVRTGRHFSDFIPADQNLKTRSQYVYRVMFFPIVIGSVVNTLLAFPVPAVLSVIYPATSSYVIMSGFGAIMKSASEGGVRSEIEERVMKSLVVLTVCVICLNRLLTLGLG